VGNINSSGIINSVSFLGGGGGGGGFLKKKKINN